MMEFSEAHGPNTSELQGASSPSDPAQTAATTRQHGFTEPLALEGVRPTYTEQDITMQSPIQELDEATATAPSAMANVSSTIRSFGSMSIDDGPTRSSNPSLAISDRLRGVNEESSTDSIQSLMSVDSLVRRNTDPEAFSSRRVGSRDNSMSSALPEDDGMRALRLQMQQIQRMAASSEEKAKRMHELMMADYQALRASRQGNRFLSTKLEDDVVSTGSTGHTRSISSVSAGPNYNPENPYNIQPGDKDPTFAPRDDTVEAQLMSADDEQELEGRAEPELGCKHYKRNVKVQCHECQTWHTCRFCHDERVPDHQMERKKIRNMICMVCATPQRAAEYCKKCDQLTANYFCAICKLWDNDTNHNIYHCEDCGICRRGRGLGKDYVHCKKCNVCISIDWALKHRCVEGATDRDCPICNDYMFNTSATVVAMYCGHYIHRKCYDLHMETSYKCPVCSKSAVNMELQWRKLDRAIEEQPMPAQYKKTKVWISCNDCLARSCVQYHWLGNKCPSCDSYNTLESRLVDGPKDADPAEAAEHRMTEETEQVFTRPPNAPSPALVAIPDGIRPIPALGSALDAQNDHLSSVTGGATTIHPTDLAPHSPTFTNTTTVGSPRSPVFSSSGSNTQEPLIEEAEMNETEAASGYTTESECDDTTFWGEGLPTPRWLQGPRSWNTPSFLASRSEEEESKAREGASEGGWHFPTPGWRSPPFFGTSAERPTSAPSEPGNRRPSSWSLPAPRWPHHRFFGSGTVQQDNDQTEQVPSTEPAAATGGWRIPSLPKGPWPHPRFLAERFGRADPSDNAVEDEDEDVDDSMEEDESETENEESVVDDDHGRNNNALDFELLGHR